MYNSIAAFSSLINFVSYKSTIFQTEKTKTENVFTHLRGKPMTEKEKMLNGDYYDSRDSELIKMYHAARKLLKKYNYIDSELTQEREEILNALFEFKGVDVWIETPFFLRLWGKYFNRGKHIYQHELYVIGQ